ncbi:MAG: tetratricopeptide repeat protein [Verrucomicrobiota bacterium]
MKTLIALIVLACSAPLVLAETAAEQAEAWYQKGLAAEKTGEPALAIDAFRAALELNPKHANARFRLGEVKLNAPKMKANAMEAKIGGIMIPTYQIEEVPIKEALEVLAVAIEKQSKDEVAPNFVIEDPTKKLVDAKVTLNLKNVPVSAILQFIHGQTNTKIRYDEHAVVILAR